MNKENFLFFGIILISVLVIGFIIFSFLTKPISNEDSEKTAFFSLEECKEAGFSKEECFKLNPIQLKKILSETNG